ncbi:hypothetical protein SAMN05660653_03045 [Desulfonatronum thiosulfatophilum]|uniref:Uncharacterized protein n=1 Tax=Desulfonatronum thiosulfatophilum TaxID=617002 RepID=A0A1G6EQ62_9BACT|nr:hypothetical protein SAMN05660653_03045 [Desulfonatronum thiosulfatophilum]
MRGLRFVAFGMWNVSEFFNFQGFTLTTTHHASPVTQTEDI